MKLTCCCFTCIIGEDERQSEEDYLIPKEKEQQNILPENDELKQAAVSPGRLLSDAEIENEETARKAAGVLKKYNVTSSKFDLKRRITEELLTDSNIDLKISIKIMVRSDAVKIFALEASNVMPVLQAKSQDTLKLPNDEVNYVQLRTKLLPTESRSHSKKYQVSESITGAMKFSNECLHTLTISEFQTRSIRFRLYYVLKHQRDILLGEYILQVPNLCLEIESGTTNAVMKLHDPSETDIKSPELCDKRRSIGSTSRNDSQSSVSSVKAYRTTIRRGDLKQQTRTSVTSIFENSDDDPVEGRFRSVFSPPIDKTKSLSPLEEYSDAVSPEHATKSENPLEKLKRTMEDRTETLGHLEQASEVLSNEASSFSEVSTRLREKYQKKTKSKKRP